MVIGGGTAVVGMDEKDRDGKLTWGARPEYARRSMAVTRAAGKAYRLTLAWIMALAGFESTPAEEMDGIKLDHDGETSGPSTNVKPLKAPQTTPAPVGATQTAKSGSEDIAMRPLAPGALREWFDTLYSATPANKKELIIEEEDAIELAKKVGNLGLTEKQRHALSVGLFGVESTKNWSEAYADIVRLWIKDIKSARVEALAFIETLEQKPEVA
jgi:hypothetical protein